MGLLFVLGCGQKPQSVAGNEDEEAVQQPLKLKTYTYSGKQGMAHVDLSIEFPVKGEEKLVNAIRQYIAERVELESDEVELSDGQGIADYYGNELMERMEQLSLDYKDDDYVNELFHDWEFSKSYDCDRYITFMGNTSLYEGGIHGIAFIHGATFFKESGKHFTADMLRKTDSPRFQKLLREALKKNFVEAGSHETISDEQLAEELINVEDVFSIPMPNADPFLNDKGVVFIYQPYEISYYAAGHPEAVISFRQMRPFLTQRALSLLGMDDDEEEEEEE